MTDELSRSMAGRMHRVKRIKSNIILGNRGGSGVNTFTELVGRVVDYYNQIRNKDLRSYSSVRDRRTSLTAVSEAVGCTTLRLRSCINGKSHFTPPMLDGMLRIMGISVLELIQDYELMETPSLLPEEIRLERIRAHLDAMDEEVAALAATVHKYTADPATHHILARTGRLVGLVDEMRLLLGPEGKRNVT